jgi:hypothetical protein
MSVSTKNRTKIRISGVAIIIILGLVVPLELVSYSFAGFLAAHGLAYDATSPDEDIFSDYIEKRDQVLGWPAPTSFGQDNLESDGARVDPRFPGTESPACVSAYGDSFTYSAEVSNQDAWPSVLGQELGCRVSNFGVGGYGTDQSLMRLQLNKFDRAPIMIIGHASFDIQRNVNQFRVLLGGDPLGFKPRFVIDQSSNQLARIDLLDFDDVDFREVYANPAKYLPYEYHLPGWPPRNPSVSFPYSVTVARSLMTRKMMTFFDDTRVYYDQFYDPNHLSNALQITEKIIDAFAREARQRESRPIVLMIPIAEDLMKFESTGQWTYQNLMTYMRDNDIEYINVGESLNEYLASSNSQICDLYQRKWYAKGGCTGHYQPIGYKLLAQSIARKISNHGTARLTPQATAIETPARY